VALLLTLTIAVVFSADDHAADPCAGGACGEIGKGGRAAIVAPEQLGTSEIAELGESLLDLAEAARGPDRVCLVLRCPW
jgi:hypothetical protein